MYLLRPGVSRNDAGAVCSRRARTALFGAVAWGRVEVTRYLLSAGARHDIANQEGLTPLHWAASHGGIDVIQILLDAGADPKASAADGRLPIDMAHQNGKGAHETLLKSVRPPHRHTTTKMKIAPVYS